MDMHIDFHDKPGENEFDRMFDYDVDGKLNPVEQAERLDFITGYTDDDEDEYVDSCDTDFDEDDDDDDYCGYCLTEAERQRQDEMLNRLREAQERRKKKQTLIICGIMIVSCIVFASSPGIILFIGAMLFSAKISKMF